jgi:anti-sigma B factor antagonist
LQLALETRVVGRVTIVRCNGRIIGGKESDSLRAHVAWLLRDRRDIILHMGDVGFIDSSGLGMMVRALANTRQARGDLKLCNVPENVRKVLDITHLATVFDAHESEENAIAAFYRPGASAETPVAAGHRVLCLDSDINVLAYLRELLRGAGYDVQSSSRLSDAMLLMRVERYHLLLVGPDMTATEARPQAFREACARMTVIELGSEFSASDAGEAGAGLLQLIEVRLNAKSA